MDARRDEVYSAVYDSNSYNKVRESDLPEIINKELFLMNIVSENKLYFIGNGQEKCE